MESRYTIRIDVKGNAEASLRKIADGVSRVNAQAGQFSSVLGSGKAEAHLSGIQSRISAMNFSNLVTEAASVVSAIGSINEKIIGGAGGIVREIIKDSAVAQDIESSLQFAFGNQWKKVYEDVKKDAAQLTFTFTETAELAASLGRLNINPFGGTTEASQIFKSKTGENIRSLQVLQDTADAVGKSTRDLEFSIRSAMVGEWTSMKRRFKIDPKEVAEWRKEIDKATDPQVKFNLLIDKLGAKYGGAGALKATNFNKAIAQIPDLLQMINAAIGKDAGGLKVITDSVWRLVAALTGLREDKTTLDSLGQGFKIIAKGIATAIDFVTGFVKGMRDILQQAPWLPSVGVAFLGIVVAGLTLTTAIGSITVGLLTMGAAIALITATMGWEALLALPVVLGLVIPVLAAGVIALGAFGLIAKASFDVLGVSTNNSISTLEKLKLIFDGLKALVASYNGETGKMSKVTFDALEASGLTSIVKRIFNAYHTVHAAGVVFFDHLNAATERLAPTLIPLFSEFKSLLYKVGVALGVIDPTKTTTDMLSWASAARRVADALIWLAEKIIWVSRVSVFLVNVANDLGLIKAQVWMLSNAASMLSSSWNSVTSTFMLAAEAVNLLVEGLVLLNSVGKSAGSWVRNLITGETTPKEPEYVYRTFSDRLEEFKAKHWKPDSKDFVGFAEDQKRKRYSQESGMPQGAPEFEKSYVDASERRKMGLPYADQMPAGAVEIPSATALSPAAGVAQVPGAAATYQSGTNESSQAMNQAAGAMKEVSAALSAAFTQPITVTVHLDGQQVGVGMRESHIAVGGGAF